MKVGLGLYRHMLTPPNFRFARQVGATHIVAHLTDYFKQAPQIPTATAEGWGAAGEPEGLWDRVMGVNLRGAFLCARAAARLMRDQDSGGVIVNIASIHDKVARLGATHYCVSKAGLTMLTQALEWAEYNIRVVGVSPGAIETPERKEIIDHQWRDWFARWVPLGRFGQTSEVADAVVFLASERASYITGTTLTVDGGYANNLVRYDARKDPMRIA